jgi:hypothetical protein
VVGVVPADGLIDVHRYLTITRHAQRVTVDVTFAGEPWDGRSSMALKCGPGEDFPAGEMPDARTARWRSGIAIPPCASHSSPH